MSSPPSVPFRFRLLSRGCAILLAGALVLAAQTGQAPKTAAPKAATQKSPAQKRLPPNAEQWVEATLRHMTLDEKIGQLIMVAYFGGFTSTESPEYVELMRQVEKNHVAGFIVVTRGSPLGAERSQAYPTAVLANQLQRKAKVPLLVAADFERGTAMRLVEGTSFPYPMAVAATGSPQDAYTIGRITAIEARAVGVHWIFAPDADVNINPDNPIINTRSFGEDPARVSEFVAAYVRGVEENGALSTAKHFPGHGDTSMDSHIGLPVITADRQRLENVELPPFRAAIAAGTSSIMMGHLAVPAVEPNTELPATLSPRVSTDLLRKEMGFEGLIVTDAMDMGGVTSRYPPGEASVLAIAAGADVLLLPPVSDASIAAIRDAVKSGRIPMSRINESVRRVLRAKARLGLQSRRLVDVDALNKVFGRPEFARAADDIANRGITLLRDEPKLLPLDATKPRRVLLAAISADPDTTPGIEFEREIRWRVDKLDVVRVDPRWQRAEFAKLPPPESYDAAIVALFVRVADRKGTVGMPPDQVALVNQLMATGKPTVVVSFGSPYLIATFPNAPTWLAAFSTFDVVQRAAGRALFGQTAIGGQIPVSVPGIAKAGDGLRVAADPMKLRAALPEMDEQLKPAFDVLDRAMADGVLSSGTLAVGHENYVAVRTFGPQTSKTPLDLSTLSQPIVTATLAAMLFEAGQLPLESPVVRYIPEFAEGPQPEWRSQVTVRHLLMHTSGLADEPLDAPSGKDLLKRICSQPLSFQPGTAYQFSRPGYALLGEIIERQTGRPLADLAQERIFTPLGMKDTSFKAPASLRSTASDLAVFSQMLLNGGMYAHRRYLRRATIELFAARLPVAGAVHSLIWDVGPGEGGALSPRSFGYDARNGASLWIAPEKELFVILLPSEIASGNGEKVRALRDPIHRAVIESLIPAPSKPSP